MRKFYIIIKFACILSSVEQQKYFMDKCAPIKHFLFQKIKHDFEKC